MEQHYTWLFDKSDSRGLWWASFCSLLLHGLMFAIMATTSIYFPLAGESSKLDIVWIYPSFLFGGEADSTSPPPTPPDEKAPSATKEFTAAAARTVAEERQPARETATSLDRAPLPPPAPKTVTEPVRPAPPEPLISEEEPEPEAEPEMSIPQEQPPAPMKKATSEPQGRVVAKEPPAPLEKGQLTKKESEKKIEPPVKATDTMQAKVERPALAPVSKPTAPSEQPPVSRKPPLPVEKPQPPAQQAAAKITTPSQPSPATSPRETAALPAAVPQTPHQQGVSGGERPTTEKRKESPPDTKAVTRNKAAETPPAKSTGPKGIFAPPLSGDLKIEITGSDEALKAIKISVVFREYAKTRHSRPMTKANFRNSRELSPKMARVAKNTLQAVIEIAGEGVYDFRNISNSATPAEAAFTVKIYENSGRAKTKSAGSRMVSAKGSIVKVLMPEGILWDDDSAFSGSMEDSESVTRFNTDSGLVWKEYKE